MRLKLTHADPAGDTATPPAIEASHLVKSFAGKRALSGASLAVAPGSIVGLVGANGAGKSTLIQTLLGLLRPDLGEARLLGENSWDLSPAAKERLGYAAQRPHAFHWMTTRQMVRYVGSFYARFDPSLAEALMSRWQLDPRDRCDRISGGQKQRLELVLAMSHRPDLLLLDEPAASLDPAGRRDLLDLLLRNHRDDGQTVLFSSHITSDLERVASHVAVMVRGRGRLLRRTRRPEGPREAGDGGGRRSGRRRGARRHGRDPEAAGRGVPRRDGVGLRPRGRARGSERRGPEPRGDLSGGGGCGLTRRRGRR